MFVRVRSGHKAICRIASLFPLIGAAEAWTILSGLTFTPAPACATLLHTAPHDGDLDMDMSGQRSNHIQCCMVHFVYRRVNTRRTESISLLIWAIGNWRKTIFICSQKYPGLIVLQSCLQKGKVVTFKRHCGEDITMFICTLSVLASLNWHYGGAGHDADSFLSRDVFQTHERWICKLLLLFESVMFQLMRSIF